MNRNSVFRIKYLRAMKYENVSIPQVSLVDYLWVEGLYLLRMFSSKSEKFEIVGRGDKLWQESKFIFLSAEKSKSLLVLYYDPQRGIVRSLGGISLYKILARGNLLYRPVGSLQNLMFDIQKCEIIA